jgi:hypothetical protein
LRIRKIDSTQHEIVIALRRCGCLVWIVNAEIDLVVQRAGRIYLLEVKAKGGRLTDTQLDMVGQGWNFAIVHNVTEAAAAVGLNVLALAHEIS